jgi:hypothetical protein
VAVKEVDENQLVALQQLNGFVQKALASPKHRSQLLRIQKDLYPEIAVPEIDAADPVLEKLTALEKRLEDDAKARSEEIARKTEEDQKRDWERQWMAGRKKLADSNVPSETIESIEKLMADRNLPDHEAAAALWEKLNPPPPPPMTGSSRFDWFKDMDKQPDLKRLYDQDYDGFLGEAIDAARRDFRAGVPVG